MDGCRGRTKVSFFYTNGPVRYPAVLPTEGHGTDRHCLRISLAQVQEDHLKLAENVLFAIMYQWFSFPQSEVPVVSSKKHEVEKFKSRTAHKLCITSWALALPCSILPGM